MLEHFGERGDAPSPEYFPDYFVTGLTFRVEVLPGAPNRGSCVLYNQLDLSNYTPQQVEAIVEMELILHRMHWHKIQTSQFEPRVVVTDGMLDNLLDEYHGYFGNASRSTLEGYMESYNWLMDKASELLDEAEEALGDEDEDEDGDSRRSER